MRSHSGGSSQQSDFAQQSYGGVSHEARLTQFIRRQVIPRLAVAHGLPQKIERTPHAIEKPSIAALSSLADLAIREESAAVVAYVEALVGRGVPIEDVYLEWLAPAARQMGCDWESDRTDFSSVTIGMWKLQQAMQALSPTFLKDTVAIKSPRRILLASVPGEPHTMGLFMVSEFFRRSGWSVWSELPSDYEDIVGKVRGEWFDLIGLSVGGDHKLDALTQAIAALRRASRNAEALIMLGGPVLTSNPEIVVAVGADLAAGDARHAVERAEKAVASRLSEQFRR
jgi:methanogenic corrinoid protein MtbC1